MEKIYLSVDNWNLIETDKINHIDLRSDIETKSIYATYLEFEGKTSCQPENFTISCTTDKDTLVTDYHYGSKVEYEQDKRLFQQVKDYQLVLDFLEKNDDYTPQPVDWNLIMEVVSTVNDILSCESVIYETWIEKNLNHVVWFRGDINVTCDKYEVYNELIKFIKYYYEKNGLQI
jgi:hypothetical protein